MKEADLRKRLKENWKPCHCTSIEGATSFGMPDTHWTFESTRAWIELKVNYNGKLKFRPNQLAWMEREFQLGWDTWIVWFDSRLRACTYTFLREWEKHPTSSGVTISIHMPEVFTGDFQELKNVISGGLQE